MNNDKMFLVFYIYLLEDGTFVTNFERIFYNRDTATLALLDLMDTLSKDEGFSYKYLYIDRDSNCPVYRIISDKFEKHSQCKIGINTVEIGDYREE